MSFRIFYSLLTMIVSLQTVAADTKLPEFAKATFREYCARCHGLDGESQGDVDLLEFQLAESPTGNVELLNDLREVIKHREMPPETEEQLPDAERAQLLSLLDGLLETAIAQNSINASTPIRRMNRLQYNNAVTDLFQLRCVVFTLPERMLREHKDYFQPHTGKMADTVIVGSRPLGKSQMIEPRLAGVAAFPQDLRAEHGFDNRGDHLSLSPLLMEAFLQLGQSITESPDFGSKQVGIWQEFFASPALQPLSPSDAVRAIIHERLEPFLRRAFRRPVDARTLERYVSFAFQEFEDSKDFTEAMKAVAAAAIASPKFLYLYDSPLASHGDDAAVVVDENLALASRLSFFLWGSLPDRHLIDLATTGRLNDSRVLSAEVQRMLRDEKVKRFCDSFPSQWLQLERIISAVPDPELFPDFYFAKYRDSMHMMAEPLLLFETVLIENLPITQFIDSDFTYRSHLLREAYGEDLTGNQTKGRNDEVTTLTFERLPITDRRYGGLITNAAVMTMTSGRNRTQPITRGAWLATVIFNDPPEPPPADVPPLSEKPEAGEESLTLRERLEQHRARADCRGCHEQIDPLGFALENFNPIGVWRDRYENGREVDMAGTLFRKHKFENVLEFKDAILAEKERFAEGFASHLLSFALARQLTPADSRALHAIVSATVADDYRIQTMIEQVVLSEPFRSSPQPQSGKEFNVPN